MKKGYFKIYLPILTAAVVALFLSATTNVFAWQKDGGANCQNVFAKIKNEDGSKYSGSRDGYVKYIRTETDNDGDSNWEWRVGPIEGDVADNVWVDVNWTPPAGFSGDVEAVAAIYKNQNSQDWDDTGDFLDYKKITAHINCPAPTPTPSPSKSPTPSPYPSPSVSPSPTPTPTPSPSVNPCPTPEVEVESYNYRHSSPTPTACPTPTPTPTPPSVGGGNPGPAGAGAPTCPNDRPQRVDQVWFTDIKEHEVTVHWANKGDAFGYHIAYGPAADQLIWGVEVGNISQTTLQALPNANIFVQVIAKSSQDCGGPSSDVFKVGPAVLAATGNTNSAALFAAGFAAITLGLWQTQKRLSKDVIVNHK